MKFIQYAGITQTASDMRFVDLLLVIQIKQLPLPAAK
jgi:hypothetical protein